VPGLLINIDVPDLAAAEHFYTKALGLTAGARQDRETLGLPYGKQAMFADPFGNGFCLIEFNESGYDAIAT